MGNNGADASGRTWRDGPLGWIIGIFSLVGLALSVSSFVENLHMGKYAIAFVVEKLSQIDGWADAVKAVAAIFHGALEWWRGVLKDLLSYLPFHVPQWLHDPISVALFSYRFYRNAFFRLKPMMEARSSGASLVSSVLKFYGAVLTAMRAAAIVALLLLGVLVFDEYLYPAAGMPNEYFAVAGGLLLLIFLSLLTDALERRLS